MNFGFVQVRENYDRWRTKKYALGFPLDSVALLGHCSTLMLRMEMKGKCVGFPL